MKGYAIEFQQRKFSVAETLVKVAKAHKKKYCWPSQNRILFLIERYQNLGISIRTLNRDLRWLEENGYITRLRRIKVDSDGKPVFCSTLYKFKGKLFNYLYYLKNSMDRVFSFFRVPKWANHKGSPKPRSSSMLDRSVENLLITERDGSIWEYDPHTGEQKPLKR